jgi:hypothetical protein
MQSMAQKGDGESVLKTRNIVSFSFSQRNEKEKGFEGELKTTSTSAR